MVRGRKSTGMKGEALIWGCCSPLTQVGRSERRTTFEMRKILKAASAFVGEEVAGFVHGPFLTLLLLPAYFLGGRLWHNASASGGSSNTLPWPKYSSVVRWLAKRRSRSGGGGGAGLGWCGTIPIPVSAEAPLKFKYLSELKIDPFLWLSLLLCCHSSVTPPRQFLSITVSSRLAFNTSRRKNKKRSKGGRNAKKKRPTENMKGQRGEESKA